MRWKSLVARLQFLLNVYCCRHRIYPGGKLGQEIIPRRVYNPTAMLLDQGGHDLSVRRECLNGRLFIFPHEATIALHIGAEDRGELAFHMPSLLDAPSLYWLNRALTLM